ncbi:ATP-binding protein [Baekduia soli]|uniref:ATP-binding protein n=1 Tax=Baekduia soli TaxID=496014 RepID=A0A5B8UA53_9ACTN|nr:ATP-binding protein [Baekduia soli]
MVRALDIPRDPRAPAQARHLVDALVPHVPEPVAHQARLLLSELVTNAVRHGRGPAVRVLLDASAGDGTLRCEIVDEGDGFVPTARTRPATEPGGWGLHLVEALSRRWGVREGSTHVWFELGDPDEAR